MGKINGASEEYYVYLNMVTKLFGEEWKAAQEHVSGRNLSDKALDTLFHEFMPLMYRRWYFSALTEDSLLSPANLILALNREFGVPEHITPRYTLKPDENGRLQPMYEMTEYSADKHPIIRDLQHFLDNISQTFDTSAPEAWNIPNLSLHGCEYRIFIYNVAKHLKLVKNMPSVTNIIGMVTKNREVFFENSGEVILEKVTNAVLDECIDAISEILPIRKIYKQKLYGYLKAPVPTDQIFSDVFSDTGVDIMQFIESIDDSFEGNGSAVDDILAELFQNDDDLADEPERMLSPAGMQASLMTGAFLLGLILDRYFFTPFAYYCRLIQPLFILPYRIKDELPGILDMLERIDSKGTDSQGIDIHKEIASLVCAPCTAYCLTDIGMALIKVGRSTENLLLPGDAPVKQIISSLKDFVALGPRNDGITDVVTVKITPREDKAYWQNVELPCNVTLGGLHVFFSLIYGFDPSGDCSYYPSGDENPFIEYTSRVPRKRAKTRIQKQKEAPMMTRLADILPKEPEGRLLYVLHPSGGKFYFDIKVMKTERKKAKNLPRVVRRGKGFNEE